MTKRELIDELEQMDAEDDCEVQFAYNYGDHWRTTVSAGIGTVDLAKVIHSDYHRMDKVVDEDSDDFEKAHTVILLS